MRKKIKQACNKEPAFLVLLILTVGEDIMECEKVQLFSFASHLCCFQVFLGDSI